jgi:hypothetical protein
MGKETIFNYHNIETLPKLIKPFLGTPLYQEIQNYDIKGLNSLQIKKLNKKSHPLCHYWQPLMQCIDESKSEKKLKLNEQSIFIINLYYTLEITKEIKSFDTVLLKLRRQAIFFSAVNELDVARYYVDQGYQVTAIPEKKNKTPDFEIQTQSGDVVYVEAKLIEDIKQKEDPKWQALIKNLDKILVKNKRSLSIDLIAKIPLDKIDQESITNLIEEYCQKVHQPVECKAKSEKIDIIIKELCPWEHEFQNQINLPDDRGDISHRVFSAVKRDDDFYLSNYREITVEKFTKIDIQKTVRNNVEKANKQAVAGFPLIVHVGLPNKKSSEILNITEFMQTQLHGDINRNFEKINAISVHGSSTEVNSKGINPTREHRTIIPNFKSINPIPSSFKFGTFDALNKSSISSNGQIELGYSAESLKKSLKDESFGELFFLCSHDAQCQIRLLLTTNQKFRLQLVSPELNYRNFDISIDNETFRKGKKLSFSWSENTAVIKVDSNEVHSQFLG